MLESVLFGKSGRWLCAAALVISLAGAWSAMNADAAFAETADDANTSFGQSYVESGSSFTNDTTNEPGAEETDGVTENETSPENAIAPENLTVPKDQNEPSEINEQAEDIEAPAPEFASLGIENANVDKPEADPITSPATSNNKGVLAVNNEASATSAAMSATAAPQPSITPATQTFDLQTQAQLKKRGFTYLADKNIWVYYDNNGNLLKGEQRLFDGMYYFDKKTGALSFGWTTLDDGKRAYHNDITGRALHGANAVGGNVYAFDQNRGAQTFGWMNYKGYRTYADPKTGIIKSGGQSINGAWHWIDPNTFFISRAGAISKLMSTAYSLLGVPYVWLGVYPKDGGMDCASFTWYVYKQLGINIGFETYYSVHDGYEVSMDSLEPGDLVFMYYSYRGPEHVVLYAGSGMIYEEPDFGGHCQYVSLASKNAWDATARRILSY